MREDAKRRGEVERLYEVKNFPNVSGLPYGDVIMKCWLCGFDSAQKVSNLIRACGAILTH
jgi:hypothetical protein